MERKKRNIPGPDMIHARESISSSGFWRYSLYSERTADYEAAKEAVFGNSSHRADRGSPEILLRPNRVGKRGIGPAFVPPGRPAFRLGK